MHISRLILPFLPLLAPLSLASPSSQPEAPAADILYWPVTSSQPSVLARISYDPTSLKSDVIAYSPPSTASQTGRGGPSAADPQDLVRIGLFTSTPTNPKQWVGSLTSISSLAASQEHKPTLRLHLGPSDEIFHVSWVASSSSAAASASAGLNVEVVPCETGPRPHLNRPVVVSPDGKNPEEALEKTFFQKYWWVFLIITFLAMSGSGEGQ